jgi:aspartate/methionine/tyrosine aminotransferase
MHLSSLTSTAATALLTSPDLPQLIQLAAARLRDAHATAAAAFRAWGVRFVAPTAGPFVFARLLLPPLPLRAAVGEVGEAGTGAGTGAGTAAEDERALADKLKKEAGVAVVPGSAFGGWGSWGGAVGGGDVVGWFRITVAVPPDVLREGLARIGRVLPEESRVSSSCVGGR